MRLWCCLQAAQEYCKPQQRATEIQVWLQQADALFSNVIPSTCWNKAASFPDDTPQNPAQLAAMTQRWRAALDALRLEFEARRMACGAWLSIYLGPEHPRMAERLLQMYTATCTGIAIAISGLPSGMSLLEDETASARDLTGQVLSIRSGIDSAEALAVEAVNGAVGQVQSPLWSCACSLIIFNTKQG